MGIICTIPEPHFEEETIEGGEVAPVAVEGVDAKVGEEVVEEEVETKPEVAKSNLLLNPYLNRYGLYGSGWNNGGYNPYSSLYNPYMYN